MWHSLEMISRNTGTIGLALAGLIYLSRGLIAKNILSNLSNKQTYSILLVLISALVTLGMSGLVLSAWVKVSAPKPEVIVSSRNNIESVGGQKSEIGQSAKTIQNAQTINNSAIMPSQTAKKPRAVDYNKIILVNKIDPVEMRRVWPAIETKGEEATSILTCHISRANEIYNCEANSSDPEAFGLAMIKLFAGRQLAPLDGDGEPVAGRVVTIPVHFEGYWDGYDWRGTEFEEPPREPPPLPPPPPPRPEPAPTSSSASEAGVR